MNCIIVDDEYPSREEIKYYIQKYSCIEITNEFDEANKALKYLEEEIPDVIFLDVNIPGLNGIDIARIINRFTKKPLIVFITAYKEYAASAFEINAFDYILKPFSDNRIKETLERLEKFKINKTEKTYKIEDKLAIKKDDIIVMVKIADICYCKSQGKITVICTEKEEYNSSLCISKLFEVLPKKIFFRCHRCYIVNSEKVEQIIPWFNSTYVIKVNGNNEKISISRNKITEFKHFMHI